MLFIFVYVIMKFLFNFTCSQVCTLHGKREVILFFRQCSQVFNLYRKREVSLCQIVFSSVQSLWKKVDVCFFQVLFSRVQSIQKKRGILSLGNVLKYAIYAEKERCIFSDSVLRCTEWYSFFREGGGNVIRCTIFTEKERCLLFFRYCSQVCNMYEKRYLFFQVVFISIVKMKIILIIIVFSKESIILGQGVIINIVLITIIMMHINYSALNPFTQ